MKPDSYQIRVKNIQSNLLSYAYMLTSDRDNAYRLLSDTTATVLDNRDGYSGELSLKEWAFDTMRSIFNKKYSRIINKVEVHDNNARFYHIDIDVENAEDGYAVDQQLLTQEIDKLEGIYADVYRMYIAGYTSIEIADRYHLTEYAVHSRLAYAIRYINSRLNPQ